jgi:hypothetical protein
MSFERVQLGALALLVRGLVSATVYPIHWWLAFAKRVSLQTVVMYSSTESAAPTSRSSAVVRCLWALCGGRDAGACDTVSLL